MFRFLKSSSSEPLAVTMTGVKLGDRVFVAGLGDPKMIAALAVKAGLTGQAVLLDPDESRLRAAGQEIEREGGLIDLTHAPLTSSWPFADGHFDIAVLHDVLPALSADGVALAASLHEVLRTLRGGGRAIVIDGTPRRGLGGIVPRQAVAQRYATGSDAVGALKAAGFSAVRVLAERDGTIFTEGVKRA
jgi:ubiquinone/menaquinone biosynthesis C-methylase UbiE